MCHQVHRNFPHQCSAFECMRLGKQLIKTRLTSTSNLGLTIYQLSYTDYPSEALLGILCISFPTGQHQQFNIRLNHIIRLTMSNQIKKVDIVQILV